MCQYVIDHDGLVVRLAAAAGRGVNVRITLDNTNFKDSSCSRQPERLRSLYDAGVRMRTLKLKLSRGSFACMHSKMVLYDSDTVTLGSANWTHNGFEFNKEHVVRIISSPLNIQCAEDFENVWSGCAIVDRDRVEEACRLKEERVAKRAEQQAALRRSRSLEVESKTTSTTTTRASKSGGAVAM